MYRDFFIKHILSIRIHACDYCVVSEHEALIIGAPLYFSCASENIGLRHSVSLVSEKIKN